MEYDPAPGTYVLPAEHAVCLTGTSSRNLAANSQGLAMLAKRLPAVVDCFRSGGGVPYSEFRPDFTEYMDASWRLLYDGLLIKGFLPAVKGLPERLAAGIRVADLGCGTGHAVNLMAREYPIVRLRRLRHRRGRDREGSRRSTSDGPLERAVRDRRRNAPTAGGDQIRSHHLLRRDPRSARPGGEFCEAWPRRSLPMASTSPSSRGPRANSRRTLVTRLRRGCTA